MYPRNAASPERIAVGAVVQISDGAVQTSGVTITVRGQGGAEATGGGTTVYGGSGVVYYTPTQAESDFTSFVVIASKTGCIPVAQTIVTTATATPGYVVAANLDVAVSTRMATYTQPTGFLAATFPATVASTTNITAGTITTVSGNVDGNVTGSVGSVVGAVGSVTGSVGSVVGLTAANLDVAVSTRLATAGYTSPLDAAGTRTAVGLASANLDTQISTLLTSAAYVAPDNASITAIKAKTDGLVFTVAGAVDANVTKMNGYTVTGTGVAGDLWRGA